jgi:hypothetical protein
MTMRERLKLALFRNLRDDDPDWEDKAIDAVLAELETPTDRMLNAALVARYPDWGEAQYADSDDARVIDGMRSALAASAKAAREGK